MKQNKRKHFFINKSLQGHYFTIVISTLLLVSSVAGLCVYFGIWNSVMRDFSSESIKNRLELSVRLREYADAREETSPENITLSMMREFNLFSAREREILNDILANAYKQLTPLLLLLIFTIGWGSIFITHKVAGPIFRMQDSFMRMTSGKLNFRIQLRKYDEARELAPLFNTLIDRLDRSMAAVKKHTNELSQSLEKNACPRECFEILQKIKDEADAYETSGS